MGVLWRRPLPWTTVSANLDLRARRLNAARLRVLAVPLLERTRWTKSDLGSDAQLLRELSQRMDFTFIFYEHWQDRMKFGSFEVIDFIQTYLKLNHLTLNRCMLWKNNFYKQELLDARVEWTPLLLATPRAAPLPAWSLPLRAFGVGVWAVLLATALSYALAWRLVAGSSQCAKLAAALRAFSSCGGSPQNMAHITSKRLQLAGALLAAAVLLPGVYQSRLFALMAKPQRHPEVDTAQKILDTDLPRLITVDTQSFGVDLWIDEEPWKKLIMMMHNDNNKTLRERELLSRARSGHREAILMLSPTLKGMRKVDVEEYDSLHFTPIEQITRVDAMAVPWNSPWRDTFNRILQHAVQGGIVLHLQREDGTRLRRGVRAAGEKEARAKEGGAEEAITKNFGVKKAVAEEVRLRSLADVLVLFGVWLGGLVAASAILVAERCWHSMHSAKSW